MIKSAEGGKGGSSSSFVLSKDGSKSHRFAVCVLPDKVSRNNHPMSVHRMTELISSACGSVKGDTRIVVVAADKEGDDASSVLIGPLASAIAKVYPLYSRKTRAKKEEEVETKERNIFVSFLDKDGKIVTDESSLHAANAASE
eukprot:6928072-Ditylum_brightwellii.AAC.1